MDDARENIELQGIVDARAGRDWCLFVDRDGVVNRRIVGDYVRTCDDFELLDGAIGALADLSAWAPRVVIVTNQQGVAKGLTSLHELEAIHARLVTRVARAGGRIDDVLVCPHLAERGCPCRKPAPGMATTWLAANPAVDPSSCIVVGDSGSDIAMGRAVAAETGGCVTVEIGPGAHSADLTFPSLRSLADAATPFSQKGSA